MYQKYGDFRHNVALSQSVTDQSNLQSQTNINLISSAKYISNKTPLMKSSKYLMHKT